jgi:hypothetical protein
MSFLDWLEDIPIVGELLIWGELVSPENYSDLRAEMFWTEVGDTWQDTRSYLLGIHSTVPVELDAEGKIIGGLWTDPHGFTSTNPNDFDIDHRVPFSQIVRENPEIFEHSRAEQLAVYNDRDNLQIVESHHNRYEKGSKTFLEHAKEFKSVQKGDEFLQASLEYIEKLKRKIG